MKVLGTLLLGAGTVVIALGAGYVVALVLTISLGAIFPLRPGDEGTARVWILAGITYLAWGLAAAFVFWRLWRWLRTP
ncbi:MAG TPA: hypothetical protein VGK16_06620 [Candidatus Limnocylindrales bacterium]|jgi:hypothetical protein